MLKISVFLKVSLIVFALFFSADIWTYQIGARVIKIEDGEIHFDISDLKFREFERNHEIMTATSLYCLMRHNKNTVNWVSKPSQCTQSIDETFINKELKPFLQGHFNSGNPTFLKYLELLITVRWSDDPLRQIHSASFFSQSTFTTLVMNCEALMADVDSSAGSNVFERKGLFCNSHFGSLQFLHAMASHEKELAYQTYNLMLQWTNFAYEVSVTDGFHGKDYCDYWSEFNEKIPDGIEINSTVYPNMSVADAFYQESLDSLAPCNEQEHIFMKLNPIISFFGGKPYAKRAKWSLGTIFNWECELKPTTCGIYVDGRSNKDSIEALNTSVQMTALGSILHMFQDSFSRAHTVRLSSNVDPLSREPMVITNPIVGFLTYKGQDGKLHEESDKLPKQTTSDGGTLDPITAGAWLLFYHARDWKAQKFDKSVTESLFTKTMGNLDGKKLVKATSGEQYVKK